MFIEIDNSRLLNLSLVRGIARAGTTITFCFTNEHCIFWDFENENRARGKYLELLRTLTAVSLRLPPGEH